MRASFVMSGVARGLRRNLTMTVALVLNTSISLAFLGAAILANREIDKFQHLYENKLNVSIYLCSDVPSTNCTSPITDVQKSTIATKLAADKRVKSYSFITQQEALDNAKKIFDPSVVTHLQLNDFPSSFLVKLNDLPRDYDAIAAAYRPDVGVDNINNQDETVKILLKTLDGFRLAFLIVAFIVLIAAVLVMSNTIQVAAQQRRSETGIMRLVGASRLMTELPFMIEAVIATIAGGVIAMGFLWVGKHYVLDGVFNTQVHRGIIPNLDINDVLVAGGGVLVAAIVLAALTAFTTLRLYVRL